MKNDEPEYIFELRGCKIINGSFLWRHHGIHEACNKIIDDVIILQALILGKCGKGEHH